MFLIFAGKWLECAIHRDQLWQAAFFFKYVYLTKRSLICSQPSISILCILQGWKLPLAPGRYILCWAGRKCEWASNISYYFNTDLFTDYEICVSCLAGRKNGSWYWKYLCAAICTVWGIYLCTVVHILILHTVPANNVPCTFQDVYCMHTICYKGL